MFIYYVCNLRRYMKNNTITFAGVEFGKDSTIEPFCIIGVPPRGVKEGELVTVFGNNILLRSNTVIYAGNKIGNNFQTGNKVNIREKNTIGHDVSVGTLSVIEHHVKIERGVRIHSQVFIPEFSILEEECWVGPNVVLTNARYPASANAKKKLIGPVIKKGAKIGANVTILPGVVVGENALVGAGSVVTKDVPAATVVVGNPAKIINNLSELPYGDN
jgi:acetyltransferase-like isoleucine patch superfamily enzyme